MVAIRVRWVVLVVHLGSLRSEKHVSVSRNVPTNILKCSPCAWTRVWDACNCLKKPVHRYLPSKFLKSVARGNTSHGEGPMYTLFGD